MYGFNPYLNFKGTTEEAFNFYRSVFGGEFAMVMRFGDTPGCEDMPEVEKSKIMHIALPLSTGNILMGTDVTGEMADGMTEGNNFSLSVSANTKEEADTLFNKLSAGGKTTMPMQDMFWGAYYGMCTDKFGIQWMVSYDERYLPKQ